MNSQTQHNVRPAKNDNGARMLLQSVFILAFFAVGNWLYAQGTFLGLRGKGVGDIKIFGDTIYAGTSDGIFKHSLSSPDTVWSDIGLRGKTIRTVLVVNDSQMYAVRNLYLASDSVLAYKTMDRGNTWFPVFKSASSPSGNPTDSFFDVIDNQPGSFDTVYLIDVGTAAIFKTTDGGTHWQTSSGTQWRYRFVKVDPSHPNHLWFGGEGAIFNPILFQSTDYGGSWNIVNLGSVFEGDNACHTLVVHPSDSSTWYIPGEGKVVKTTDGGLTWNVILRNSFYNFDMGISPVHSGSLYVAGGNYVYRSLDAGASWDSLTFPQSDPCLCSFFDLEVAYRGGLDVVVAGTNDGVYKFEFLSDGVERDEGELPTKFQLFNSAPNPFNPRTTIRFSIPHASEVSLKIFNVLGVEISTLVDGELVAGEYSIAWDASAVASGVYFCRLRAGNYSDVKKMVLTR